MQECFGYLGYQPEDCPESARAAAETLALPIFPELTGQQLQHVVDCIASFVKGL
jgi:dTDP-4-amino-4,6-dideoxygalactose transaminase